MRRARGTRQQRLSLRLTQVEADTVAARAKAAGQTVAEYGRGRVLAAGAEESAALLQVLSELVELKVSQAWKEGRKVTVAEMEDEVLEKYDVAAIVRRRIEKLYGGASKGAAA